METVIRNVGELDASDRTVLERVVGKHLGESQQLVIQVVSVAVPPTNSSTSAMLPEWCNVYENLSEAEIAEIESGIVRSRLGRNLP